MNNLPAIIADSLKSIEQLKTEANKSQMSAELVWRLADILYWSILDIRRVVESTSGDTTQ